MPALTVIDFPDEPEGFDIEAQAEFVSAGGVGDTFQNDGKTGLYVKNASGAPITVTIVANRDCDHGFRHNAAPTVPDGFAGFIAMSLANDRFNTDQGIVQIGYSDVTNVEVAAVRMPN